MPTKKTFLSLYQYFYQLLPSTQLSRTTTISARNFFEFSNIIKNNYIYNNYFKQVVVKPTLPSLSLSASPSLSSPPLTIMANNGVISQLEQLQSPPPQPTARESPITQVAKTRHRSFLSQLLCCFKPTSSEIYQDSNSFYHKTDVAQHQNPSPQKYLKHLLPQRKPSDNRICLVIDLDETLVHSSFKPIENADFIVPVEIDGTLHKVYVSKRPHVDEFLKRMGQIYECVLFTASLAKYADPVADLLDKENIFKARLFRESCAFYRGNYVKDLSRLGRDLNRVIIVDNSPASYIFHPDNAVSSLVIVVLVAKKKMSSKL